VAVKAKLSTYDDLAVLEDCEHGEAVALASYRDALERDLPAPIRNLVERQYERKTQSPEVRNMRFAEATARSSGAIRRPIMKRRVGYPEWRVAAALAFVWLAVGCDPKTVPPPEPKTGPRIEQPGSVPRSGTTGEIPFDRRIKQARLTDAGTSNQRVVPRTRAASRAIAAATPADGAATRA
jgi:hypothetical protein